MASFWDSGANWRTVTRRLAAQSTVWRWTDKATSMSRTLGSPALKTAAHEAGDSRIWAGVHYASDRDAGEVLGKAVKEQ